MNDHDRRVFDKLYQAALNINYGIMTQLVKEGRMAPGWQRDRQVIRTLKKAAKKAAMNKMKSAEGIRGNDGN